MEGNKKSVLVYVGLICSIILLIVASCVHELPVPVSTTAGITTPTTPAGATTSNTVLVTCSTDTVYFNNTVLPLINSVCGKSGCHGTTNRNAFSLASYSYIQSRLGTSNGLSNALQDMADKLKDNPSLNYTPPSADQLSHLQKWISQGAKNNSCNGCDTTQFTYATIVSPIISTYCKGCHNGPSGSLGVDLSSLTAIQAEIANNPGRLLGSIQWTAPYTGAKQMPSGGSQLPACYITQIKKWIAAGAANN